MRFLAVVIAGLVAAGPAFAQDDKEKLKKEILQKVEEMIKAEEARILKQIEELLDRELAKKPDEPPKPKPDEPPKKQRGYLGVRPGELTDDDRQEFKIKEDEGGVKIAEVIPETAADGKLEADDVILQVNGEKVSDVPGLIAAVQKSGAGSEITFSIVREGKRMEVKLKLGVHPDDK
jgi:S1-C subfamily serine protease